ncbi:MAG: entericidin EcnAB [Sulfurimonas sp.]|nr:entericidin EcnAB [Sulfurimonas sp.]
MKKFFSFLAVFSILALSSGCSATWEGVKEDSNKAWNSTKGTIHEATE